MDDWECLRVGSKLAANLVGLPGEVAFDRASQAGFDPQLVGLGEPVTADMKYDRITLVLDSDGVVRDAHPG